MPAEKTANLNTTGRLLVAGCNSLLSGHRGAAAENLFCAHVGTSMNPTLSKQDILEIKPYGTEDPKVGDVVLLKPPQQDNYIVHRIIGKCGVHFQTKGDGNGSIDSWTLKKDNIYGRIIAAHRGTGQRKITHGLRGSMTWRYCHLRRLALHVIIFFLRPVYRSFCPGGLWGRLNPVRLSPRGVTFQSGTHVSHKLLLGRKVIGFYDDNHLRWRIKRPYRILVDESSLPVP
ncbi:MAG: S26 family signal peptidase [Desulfobulbales bacterium]|nr:S26 family signal peptidase [Desulfobulbales bacterium]